MFSYLIQWKILFILTTLVYSQPSKTNLIVNGDFTEPSFADINYFSSGSTPGWSCTMFYEIFKCDEVKNKYMNNDQVYPFCVTKALDLNSLNYNQIVTQQIKLKSENHLLSFNYNYPSKNSTFKTIHAQFNQKVILSFTPHIIEYAFPLYYQIKVNGIEGTNTLRFQNLGMNNGVGFVASSSYGNEFEVRASKYLRPFTFQGVLLPLFLEGNIEEVIFYAFAELKSFFSLNLKHKLFNTLVLAVFFNALLTCFGLYFFFRFHYGKKAKVLIEGKDSLLRTVASQEFDKGALPYLCGAFHQLLLSVPTFQIIVLATLEMAVIAKKVALWSCYEKPALLWISILSGLIRLFQFTTFLYTFLGEGSRTILNDDYHKVLAYLLISSISLEMLAILAYTLKGLLEMLQKSNANQVQNNTERQKRKH